MAAEQDGLPPRIPVESVAEFFGVHPETVKAWVRRGELRCSYRMRSRWLFAPEDLSDLAARNSAKQQAAAPQENPWGLTVRSAKNLPGRRVA